MKHFVIFFTVFIAFTLSAIAQEANSSFIRFNKDSNIVTLQLDSTSIENFTLNIYNSKDILVKTATVNYNQSNINVSDMVDGFYKFSLVSPRWTLNYGFLLKRGK